MNILGLIAVMGKLPKIEDFWAWIGTTLFTSTGFNKFPSAQRNNLRHTQ